MLSFKQFILLESAAHDVKSIFNGSDRNLHFAASIYADYLDDKDNSTKADLIRYYLDNPDDLQTMEMLDRIARSGLSGFASPYSDYAQDLSDYGDEGAGRGPYFAAHFTIDYLFDYFDISPETRERINYDLAGMNWRGAVTLGLTVPVKKEFATQAFESQKSIRQYIAEHPNLKSKILDYNKMDLHSIFPVTGEVMGFRNNLPNIVDLVIPNGLSASQKNKLQPRIESNFAKAGDIPAIMNDYEDYNMLLVDLKRVRGGD